MLRADRCGPALAVADGSTRWTGRVPRRRLGQHVPVPDTFLLVGWAGGGNVNPLICLAHELSRREIEVAVLGGRGLSPRLEAAGLNVVVETPGALPGADDLLAVVEALAPDALVVDYMLTQALCGAEASGRPTVALVHTLYQSLLVDGAPHPMTMAGPLEALNDCRDRLGLGAIEGYSQLLSAASMVAVTVSAHLDAPGPLPPNVRYLGPLIPRVSANDEWGPPPGAGPLVAVSMGTGYTLENEAEVTQRVMDGLGLLEVRGLVNVPGYIDPGSLLAPANVTVTGLIPHQLSLPHASALVTHAGLGSVTAALTHGLPMVCLPLGREQPENAAAVAALGRGIVIPADAPAEIIAQAVTDALALGPTAPIPSDPAMAAQIVLDVLSSTGAG